MLDHDSKQGALRAANFFSSSDPSVVLYARWYAADLRLCRARFSCLLSGSSTGSSLLASSAALSAFRLVALSFRYPLSLAEGFPVSSAGFSACSALHPVFLALLGSSAASSSFSVVVVSVFLGALLRALFSLGSSFSGSGSGALLRALFFLQSSFSGSGSGALLRTLFFLHSSFLGSGSGALLPPFVFLDSSGSSVVFGFRPRFLGTCCTSGSSCFPNPFGFATSPSVGSVSSSHFFLAPEAYFLSSVCFTQFVPSTSRVGRASAIESAGL